MKGMMYYQFKPIILLNRRMSRKNQLIRRSKINCKYSNLHWKECTQKRIQLKLKWIITTRVWKVALLNTIAIHNLTLKHQLRIKEGQLLNHNRKVGKKPKSIPLHQNLFSLRIKLIKDNWTRIKILRKLKLSKTKLLNRKINNR